MNYKIAPLILALICGSAQARLNRVSAEEVTEKLLCKYQSRPEVCEKIIKRHLIRDLKGCQVDPDLVKQAPQLMTKAKKESVKIRGRNAFLGLIPLPYRYTVKNTGTGLEVHAKVFFTNHKKLSSDDLSKMQYKLDTAAVIWTRNNPYPFPVTFKFEITDKRWGASVKTKLLRGKYTRGPYFSLWTDLWGHGTIAHEMGHVMGLDDEYSNTPFRSLNYCSGNSIMCTSAAPQPYHYYLILRRSLCGLFVRPI